MERSPNARSGVGQFSLGIVALAAGLLACSGGGGSGGGGGVSGPVLLLTADNPNGDDDDPSVALDPQGGLHVAWFSDRDGTKDLYEVHALDIDLASGAIQWSPPVQVTDNDPLAFPPPTQGDNFPSLLIDPAGVHHLAWHRVDAVNASHILYAKSDGTPAGWAAATVVDVTSGPNYDRFPHLARFAADDLRIYFNSSTQLTPGVNDMLVARSDDGGDTWGAPEPVASLATGAEQTTFFSVLRPTAPPFAGTLVRWKLPPSADFLDPSSDVLLASSADGEAWTVAPLTSDPLDAENDLTPSLFRDHAGELRVAWATISTGDPAADIVQMKVADAPGYPDLVEPLSPALGVPDHSPELVPLVVDGQPVYAMFWVRIASPPHNQVVYRLFSAL